VAVLVLAGSGRAALLDSRTRADPVQAAAVAQAWRARPLESLHLYTRAELAALPGEVDPEREALSPGAWDALLGDDRSALPGCDRIPNPDFLARLRASIERVTGLGPDKSTVRRLQAFLANEVLFGLYKQTVGAFLASRPLVGEVVRCKLAEGQYANYRGMSSELKVAKRRYPELAIFYGETLQELVRLYPVRGASPDPLDRYLDTVILHELLHQAGASHYRDIAEPRDIVSGASLCASGASGDAPYAGPAATRAAICRGALRDAAYFQSVYGRAAARWAAKDHRRQSAGFGRPGDDPEGPPPVPSGPGA
jgi:hypothetical protein